MKIYSYLAVLFFIALFEFTACAKADDLGERVAMESLSIEELATGRPSKINLWFPKGQCTQDSGNINQKSFCLADTANLSRVIVFSHGAMGSALEYSWLEESLAAVGFIVVGVNHFGESWVYGQDKINLLTTGFIWQRAQDISAVLDYLSGRHVFQKEINWTNVTVIGHSAGGQTAALMAGATFDIKQLIAYCSSAESNGDRSCGYVGNSSKAPESFLKLFSSSQKDLRVKMIVLLDPALGSAVNVESLNTITVPSLVIGAAHNDFLPWKNHGLRYANGISNAKISVLNGQEGHFVFINPCDNSIKVMDIPLCVDRAGIDRNATQKNLEKIIIEFVKSENNFSNSPVIGKEYHKPFNASDNYSIGSNSQLMFMLNAIIANTPRWVIGLLLGLMVFGLMQTRTRQVSMAIAMTVPIGMLCLSLSGILSSIGLHFSVILAWLLGIAIVACVYVKWFSHNVADYDATAKKLNIRGSWFPLFVIIAIFLTRYVLAVAISMNLKITQGFYFPVCISLILGSASGYFFARGVVYLRVKQVAI